ncbi:squalene/phytoene synthase family protein [Streptomyces sp. MS2.AVA.5]|uniref:Squalene/phytoene synthase family protein n=1 Tax=Streptomyces achmelvichensis TaxID=3134111 RepID=A0ACC6PLS1_9ACTN
MEREGDWRRRMNDVAAVAPSSPVETYSAGCRTFIEASQRLDFLEDIAEDLQNGRLGVPQDALEKHGVTRADLREGRFSEAVGALVDQQVSLVRPGLAASHGLVDLVEPQCQPLMRALVTLQQVRLRAVESTSAELLRKSPATPVTAAFRVLAREYRSARRQRGGPPSSSSTTGER